MDDAPALSRRFGKFLEITNLSSASTVTPRDPDAAVLLQRDTVIWPRPIESPASDLIESIFRYGHREIMRVTPSRERQQ